MLHIVYFQFHRCVEIAIVQCKNSGIDCKIHALTLIGRVYCSDYDMSTLAYSFLASDSDEPDILPSTSTMGGLTTSSTSTKLCTRKNSAAVAQSSEVHTHVFCWGLNDKEQLGGPKGSKVKLPVLNDTLSSLKCTQIAGGSKSLYCVTQDGKVFACGEATNGRLGLGISAGKLDIKLHRWPTLFIYPELSQTFGV